MSTTTQAATDTRAADGGPTHHPGVDQCLPAARSDGRSPGMVLCIPMSSGGASTPMVNTAITGATVDIDGGQQLLGQSAWTDCGLG